MSSSELPGKYECTLDPLDGNKYTTGIVMEKDTDNFLFRTPNASAFNMTISKKNCRPKTKKSLAFRDTKKSEKASPPLPLTDTVLFDKEQAPIAIGSTRSLKQDKVPKEAVNWETYKPTLRVYSLKTMMDDKFEYYVRINSVSRRSAGEKTGFTWNCTLLQPTDGDTNNINVSYPPPADDPKEVAFWNNLQLRRRAAEKQDACKKEADEAILSLNHELELLSKVEPSSVSPLSTPSRKKMHENDYFHAQIHCDSKTPFDDEKKTVECLEGNQTQKGYVFRVTGKVMQIANDKITIELYAIESFNRKEDKKWSSLENIPTKQYTIRNDRALLIWRTYERFIQHDPKVGEQFQSQIACKISGALQVVYGDRLYITPACLRKDVSDEPIRDVLGTVKEISGNTMIVSLFLKEDPIKPLYFGVRATSQTDFKLDYNPKHALWKHYSRLEEDGSQQVGTVPVILKNVPGDGDCFLYALFRALANRHLLQSLTATTLPPNAVANEGTFIVAFRQYLADHLDSKLTALIQSLEKDRIESENNTFQLKIQGLSTPFQTILQSSATLDIKLADLKKAVTTLGTYVSEPEVELTKELLATLGIILDIKNDVTEKSHLYNLNERRIVLVNLRETHYNWYEFPSTTTKGGTIRRRRRRPPPRRTLRRR